MIVVSVDRDGNVIYTCNACGYTRRVLYTFRESVFWDMYNGQAILVLLGHATNEKNHETPLMSGREPHVESFGEELSESFSQETQRRG